MPLVALNKSVPHFKAATTSDQQFELKKARGSNVVIYFYPKDSTPGCTLESKAFRDHYAEFQQHETIILGVSKDTLTSHEKFKTKHCFPFELLVDEDSAVCELFDVIKEKSMFGKKYMGIERSTFLIDKNGVLKQQWRKVKVKGHVREVLAAVKALG